MFGIIADALTTTTSVLFPIFASYKAIRTSDPAQLTPWLMYWTTLSLFLAGESFLHPILSWTPFYSWIRLGVHLYLVLPGQQGSVFLYRRYLHPWMDQHERQIDNLISESHDRAKAAGLSYVQQAIEAVKTKVFGFPPTPPTAPPTAATYSQNLMSRFAMPTARPVSGLSGGANDLLGMLGNVMQQATSSAGSREAQAAELSRSGTLIPSDMTGQERATYITTQRERLQTLLQAFDTAASDPAHGQYRSATGPPRESEDLRKSRSETEFEHLGHEDIPEGARRAVTAVQQSGWGKYIWGNAGTTPEKKAQ